MQRRTKQYATSPTFVEKKSSVGDDTVAVDPLLKQTASLCINPRLQLFACKRVVTRWFAYKRFHFTQHQIMTKIVIKPATPSPD